MREEVLKNKLGEIKENPYFINAERIKDLCEGMRWDVGVGMAKLEYEDKETEYTVEHRLEFNEILKSYSLNEILEAKKTM